MIVLTSVLFSQSWLDSLAANLYGKFLFRWNLGLAKLDFPNFCFLR